MENAAATPRWAWAGRLLCRLFDPARVWDYAIAAAVAGWPLALSFLIGAHRSVVDASSNKFLGYWCKSNWTTLALFVPLGFWFFRWSVDHIAPVLKPWPEAEAENEVPQVVTLFSPEFGPRPPYEQLRRAILSPANLAVAAAILAIIHICDMREIASTYFREFLGREVTVASLPEVLRKSGELDWTVMFVARQGLSAPLNLGLVISAYAAQAFLILIGLLLVWTSLRHNLFFLNHVFQRRRWVGRPPRPTIAVNPDSGDGCFGFQRANAAFNVQVGWLAVAAFLMLISRFQNVETTFTTAELVHAVSSIHLGKLFHDPGQVMLAIGWLAALGVVSLPAVVKFLPLLPLGGRWPSWPSAGDFLREYLPEKQWPYGDAPSYEEVSYEAARFARNSFWPTGDNRAERLFFLSFVVFLILFFPVVRWDQWPGFPAYLLVLAIAGLLLTYAMLRLLKWVLAGVDRRLVSPERGLPVPERLQRTRRHGRIRHGVFLSYRHRDTRGYALALSAFLKPELDSPGRLFIDVGMRAGEKWREIIDESLTTSRVLVVLIGKSWLTASKGGRRRLDDEDDLVRHEVASGLAKGLVVIPVRVRGAALPKPEHLPGDLKPLLEHQDIEITDQDWANDVTRLVEAIAKLPASGSGGRPS